MIVASILGFTLMILYIIIVTRYSYSNFYTVAISDINCPRIDTVNMMNFAKRKERSLQTLHP